MAIASCQLSIVAASLLIATAGLGGCFSPFSHAPQIQDYLSSLTKLGPRAAHEPHLVPHGVVAQTLVLSNDTLVGGNFLAENGLDPEGGAFDPRTGDVYIADTASNVVSVLDGSSDILVGTIHVGERPSSVTADTSGERLFVTNTGSNNVSAINASLGVVTYSIPVQSQPIDAAYDSIDDRLFVTDSASNNVSAISLANGLQSEIAVGNSPFGITYDPVQDEVFVTNSGGQNVSVINASSEKVVATYIVPGDSGEDPEGITYMAGLGEVAVDVAGARNAFVVNAATLSKVGAPGIGEDATTSIYDNVSSTLVVANYGSNNLTIIGAKTLRSLTNVTVGTGPAGIVFDSLSNRLFVDDSESNNVSVVDAADLQSVSSIPLGTLPTDVVVDARAGSGLVSSSAANLLMELNDTSGRFDAEIYAPWDPTDIALSPNGTEAFVVDQYSYNLSIVSIPTGTVIRTVGVGEGPTAVVYDNSSGNVFVADGGADEVSVVDPSTGVLVQTVDVGGYPVAATFDAATGAVIIADSAADELSIINGTSLSVDSTGTTWSPSAVCYDPSLGLLLVAGHGENLSLLNATTYRGVGSIELGGSTSSISLSPEGDFAYVTGSSNNLSIINLTAREVVSTVSVGSMPISSSWDPATNQLWVDNYLQGTISMVEIDENETFNVSAVQRGLPLGIEWAATIGGQEVSGFNSSLPPVSLINGSYDFYVEPVTNYVANPSLGTLVVKGADRSLDVNFSSTVPTSYPVTFLEHGLPGGTTWWVSIAGLPTSFGGSGSIITDLVNGSYNYSANSLDAGLPRVVGSLTVNGSSQVIQIQFVPLEFLVAFEEVGLRGGDIWTVVLNGSAVSGDGNLTFANLPNGTYHFRVTASENATISPSSGSLSIRGQPVIQLVHISYPPAGGRGVSNESTVGGSTLPFTTIAGLVCITLASLGIALAIMLKRGSRRGSVTGPKSNSERPANDGEGEVGSTDRSDSNTEMESF